MKRYRIHPGIGIARIGNSTADGSDGYFLGPETPDFNFRPPGDVYRDAAHAIRRQATRFRVYEYTYAEMTDPRPTSIREVTNAEAEIHWRVDIANQKPFVRTSNFDEVPVPIAPGAIAIEGAGKSEEIAGILNHDQFDNTEVRLGTLKTDDAGRLLVLGGFGRTESPRNYPIVGLESAGWFDDVSDGPVRADIRIRDTGQQFSAESAWVVVGIPAYAAPMINIVTMYDVAYDIAVRHLGTQPPTTVSFARDIYPVLRRAVELQWVSGSARTGHGPSTRGDFLEQTLFTLLQDNDPRPGSASRIAREHVFGRLKPLSGGSGADMPRLIGPSSPQTPGARGLTLTPTQYGQFEKWSRGDFVSDCPPTVHPTFDDLSPAEQTHALDKAGLFTGVGGTFGPGIEVGRLFGETATFESPFRISSSLLPGALTSTLAIPWQSDYLACGRNWWPGGRPNRVSENAIDFREWIPSNWGVSDLLRQWPKLGFMKRTTIDSSPVIVETERQV